ncbi:MAG: TonB family protein [Acidobacteriota bacterium]|nr:TonB family protein [Acidobacteriota bacterium]
MRDFRKTALLLAAAFAAVLLASRSAAQDFSDVRMREGEAAYRARRFADAASFFRVAAFGYLDRPPMLCQALVRLALASDAAGRPADVKAAIDRLADAQRRAPACAEAEIDSLTRSDFETRFHRRWQGGEIVPAAAEASPTPASPSPAADASAPHPRPTRPARRATPEPPVQTASSETTVQEGGARLKTVVHPVYPRAALQAHVGGVVILRVLVSEEGIPVQVEIVQGIRPDLNAAAVTAIKRCVFEPPRVAGSPVRSSTTVSVPFQP